MAQFAKEYHIPRQYLQLSDLLQDGGVDALIVSTPNYLHAEQTIAGLEAGLHVLVEKPMAANAAEARSMLDTAQKTGRLLMVGHCFRFDPETVWLREQLSGGKIGTILRTRGTSIHVNWGPGGWFTQKKYAVIGAMGDMGIHGLDTSRFLLGDPLPVSVYAKISTEYGNYDVDDTGMLMVNWDNGASSIIEFGWWQPHANQANAGTQLYGKKGFASLFPTLLETPVTGPDGISTHTDHGGFSEERGEQASLQKYDAQINYFINCIEQNQTPSPGGLEGWINMQIVDAAYESSRTGKIVKIGR